MWDALSGDGPSPPAEFGHSCAMCSCSPFPFPPLIAHAERMGGTDVVAGISIVGVYNFSSLGLFARCAYSCSKRAIECTRHSLCARADASCACVGWLCRLRCRSRRYRCGNGRHRGRGRDRAATAVAAITTTASTATTAAAATTTAPLQLPYDRRLRHRRRRRRRRRHRRDLVGD